MYRACVMLVVGVVECVFGISTPLRMLKLSEQDLLGKRVRGYKEVDLEIIERASIEYLYPVIEQM